MRQLTLPKVSLALFLILLCSNCRNANEKEDADGSTVASTVEESVTGLSTTTVAPNPYDNEDLAWIGDTCEAEQGYFEHLLSTSKNGDNPDLLGEELDYWDGPLALELAKKWIDSIDEVYLALSTVGDYTLELSARESAHLTDFRMLAPRIIYYGYWSDTWSLDIYKVRESHKELDVYCSKLPPSN